MHKESWFSAIDRPGLEQGALALLGAGEDELRCRAALTKSGANINKALFAAHARGSVRTVNGGSAGALLRGLSL